MNFVRVKDTRTGIEYPWMADIQTIADFLEIEETFVSRNAWCINDYLGSKDYAYEMNNLFEGNPIPETKGPYYKDHCHPQNKLAPFFKASILTLPEEVRSVNMMQFLCEKLSHAAQIKIKLLLEHGRLLINQNGGFMVWDDRLALLEAKTDSKFPQYRLKDIKVSKWPEGIHWYITCNGASVIVDGIEKWKSEKDAWTAAKKWVGET